MTPEEAVEIVRKDYPFEACHPMNQPKAVNIARTVLKYLKPPAKILDFGAGPCDETAVLSVLGFECSACDDLKNPWHKVSGNQEKILTFAARFNISYCQIDKETDLPFEKSEFDMLMLNDVLEHLHESPRDLLNDLLSFVKPRGYFFVTVPNAVHLMKRIKVVLGRTNLPSFKLYYWLPGPWRSHIREYVMDDLVELAKYLGLDVLELHGCHHMLESIPSFLRPIWIGLTSVLVTGRDSWLLVARKKPGWAPKKSVPQKELDTILGFHPLPHHQN